MNNIKEKIKSHLTRFNIILIVLFALGLIVRFAIMFHINPTSDYQHDLYWGGFGHWDYFKYIADHFALPPFFNGEGYQPPIHYIIMAIYYIIAQILHLNIPYFLVFCTIMMNFFLFFIVKKTICLFTENKLAIFWTLAIFIFFPENIVISLFLNNDSTYLFFSVISIYYLCKWIKNKTRKNAALLGLFCALTVLTKIAGLILLGLVLVVVLIELFRKRIKIKEMGKQCGLFFIGFLPLMILYFIRLAKLGQPFFANVDDGSRLANTFLAFFRFNPSEVYKSLLPNGGMSLFEYLFSTSLFDEYGQYFHEYLRPLATLLVSFGLITYLICLIGIIKKVISKNKDRIIGIVFAIYLLLNLAEIIYFRYQYPNPWDQHFRYIIPVVFVFAMGASYVFDFKNKYFKIFSQIAFAGFIICSFIYYFNLSL